MTQKKLFHGMPSKLFAGMIVASVATFANPAMAEAAQPLVDAEWLNQNLKADEVKILDIRSRLAGGSQEVFEKAHIPGSIYSNYLEDGWRTKNEEGTIGVLPEAEDLELLFERLGLNEEDHIVIVGGGNSALDMGSAARVYWTFKMAGHKEVSILDGGFSGWAGNVDLPVEKGSQDKIEVSEYSVELQPQLLATKTEVKSALKNGTALVDNRPVPQFTGVKKHKAASRFGTIPTASNVPESLLTISGKGFFQKKDELRKLYTTTGVSNSEEVINFCNTGHWASLGWFVSHELLGNDKAKMYDGSIVEWSADKAAPMVRKASN